MKLKTYLLIGLLVLLAVILGGCATGLQASSWPGMTAGPDYAYISGGPFVYAVNLQTGVEVWRFPAKASTAAPFYATPQLTPDGQQLIVGGFDKKLYSLDPKSGAEIWRFDQAKDRWIGSVLITTDTIYAANADYNLYALSFNGIPKWVVPFQADQAIWGSPVSDGDTVYFGTLGRKVYAVNAQTGKQLWMQKLKGAVLGSPVLAGDGTLFVGTFGKEFATLDRDGKIIHDETVSNWIWEGPAADASHLFVGDADGKLYAFPYTGSGSAWTQQLNGAIIAKPLVANGKIVIGTESGNVYFLDVTGENVKSVAVQGNVYAAVVQAGDLFLVAPTKGSSLLVAMDGNGSTKWSFTPAK